VPLITVVVPTYRRPGYLASALASLRAQTLGDFEVLVCDNADQPESAAVVSALDDDRFVYIGRETDLGMTASVYDGLRRAQGEFVMKLDDDDEMEPDCLEVLAAPLVADPAVAVSASDLGFIDADGRPMPDVYAYRSSLTGRDKALEGRIRPFTAAVARGTFDMVSALIRRSQLDWSVIDEAAETSYDLHLLLVAAQDGHAAHYTRRQLVRYRQHAGSDTVTHSIRQARGALFAREQALDSGRHTDVEVLRATISSTGVHLARALLRDGQVREARATLARTGAAAPPGEAVRLWALTHLPAPLAIRVAHRRAGRPIAR
jgi:glycosyltransferase involved in cell wall biosynthesis